MGKGEPILVRLQPAQLAALDAWIGRQDAQLSRPGLVEQGARTIARRALSRRKFAIRAFDAGRS
jgi:hypothetical protein